MKRTKLPKLKFQVSQPSTKDHQHQFDEWELTSDSGIAFCDWKCKCGLVVSQLLGQRERPTKLPKDLSTYTTWEEKL